MGLIKSLKRIKLKKIVPGKIIKAVVHAGAAIGIPGAKTADNALDRIGKRVDDAKKVVAKAQAVIKQEAKDAGISTGEATDRIVARGLAGADAGISALSTSNMIFIGIAVVVLFMLLSKRG